MQELIQSTVKQHRLPLRLFLQLLARLFTWPTHTVQLPLRQLIQLFIGLLVQLLVTAALLSAQSKSTISDMDGPPRPRLCRGEGHLR